MQLGMIGLGRMGGNMVRRLLRSGHQCVVCDRSANAVAELVKEKAVGTTLLTDFVKKLTKPRAVWLMVPSGVLDNVIADLLRHLERGDILIDGGNSNCASSVLYERFSSRGEVDFADKLVSAMRYQFGDHVEKQRKANLASGRGSTAGATNIHA